MLEKTRVFFTILLMLILIFAVGFSIVKIVMSWFEKPVLVTMDNVSKYLNDENVVTSYSTYYYLNDCLNNYIEACNQKKYDELYSLYMKDYMEQYTKDEVIAKLSELQWTTGAMDKVIEYKLEKVYNLENDYLLYITLDGENLYLIFDTDSSREYDYNWAFVK